MVNRNSGNALPPGGIPSWECCRAGMRHPWYGPAAPAPQPGGRRFASADAVQAMVTLGEISDALREVWGVYRPA